MTARQAEPERRLRSPEYRAKEAGVVTRTIIREIERGALRAYKIGRQWRISDDDFEEYLRGVGGGSPVRPCPIAACVCGRVVGTVTFAT
jgi:excisionase family DNA binding protein